MKRKKWRAPNNPTPIAKIVWRAVYGEPWPTGWKVKWVGFMRSASGLCNYGRKEILINYADAKTGARHADHHARDYQRALNVAFTYGLGLAKPWEDASTEYRFWCRRASKLRMEMERHSTLERGAIEVLLHEFVHVRNHYLKHGAEFDRLVEWNRAKLMEARL